MPRKTTKKGGAETPYMYTTKRISTQPNIDPTYEEAGIIHVCESVAINMLRGALTNLFNAFGAAGFDNTKFDEVRNIALQKIDSLIPPTGKISNLRIDITTIDPTLITINLYGTLMLPRSAVKS
jgi:hypothetical protein